MLIAKDSQGKLIKITDSIPTETYKCPICGETLIRNFGLDRQFYSHPKGKDNNCELKVKLMLKKQDKEYNQSNLDILHKEYYNKDFSNIKIKLSDYKSEEGYYLTQEQKNIIFAKENKIKISALAGSGKSNTLYYYAKERPNKKMLYLVYNKSMKIEAEKQFSSLNNVDIKTIHGLAYKYVGKFYRNKLTFNYGAIDIVKDLNLDWNKNKELIVRINEMMKQFMLSDVQTFDELNMYKDNYYNKKLRPSIISACEKLWELKKDRNNNVKVEHDFYLKMFQLEQNDLSKQYDIILLDEAQDSSMLVLDIINNSNVSGVVIVGDNFQKIYGWRNATNIFPYFKGKEYKLTTSFRVSQQIANICNVIIKDCIKENIKMKGFNQQQIIVDEIDKTQPYVCLCRTNASIFGETIDAIENGKKLLYYEGGYSGYNFNNILDAYYFSLGQKTRNSLFKKFKNYESMKKYTEYADDIELKAIIKMVDSYGERIPKLINTIKNNTINNKNKADVFFSTVHKSKGETYKIPVYISNDHFDINKYFIKKFIKKDKEILDKDIFEEIAIIYVAITRCANQIQLSDTLKEYLITRYNFFK